jgi:hypothetical protein
MNAENYQLLNEKLSVALSSQKGVPLKVRAFENSLLAGYDLCFGLLQFLSHRPKVGIVRLGSSLQEYLLPHFYRLQTPIVFKKENENFEQFVSQFDHEVNFVLWSSENEITGEVLFSDEQRMSFHKALSAKRIFSIEIKSYLTDHDVDVLKQNGYSIILETGHVLSNQQCHVYHSEKLKTPSLIGHYQNHLSDQLNSPKVKINPSVLGSFHDSVLNYFNRFAGPTKTLEDRLVISSKNVSGAALKEELQLNDQTAFAPSELPSWVLETMSVWWPEAKNADLVIGLLIIDLKAYDQNDIHRLIKAHEKLTLESTWTIP